MSRVSWSAVSTGSWDVMGCPKEEGRGLSKCGGGMALRMGEGLRLTYSWITSSDHVSIDLKEYLLATLAMSMRYTRLASGEVMFLSSDGLKLPSISPCFVQ